MEFNNWESWAKFIIYGSLVVFFSAIHGILVCVLGYNLYTKAQQYNFIEVFAVFFVGNLVTFPVFTFIRMWQIWKVDMKPKVTVLYFTCILTLPQMLIDLFLTTLECLAGQGIMYKSLRDPRSRDFIIVGFVGSCLFWVSVWVILMVFLAINKTCCTRDDDGDVDDIISVASSVSIA
jgi:hypothetical protein